MNTMDSTQTRERKFQTFQGKCSKKEFQISLRVNLTGMEIIKSISV